LHQDGRSIGVADICREAGVRTLIIVLGMFSVLNFASSAGADVAPTPPPHAAELSIALQRETTRRHGAEMNERVHRSISAIVVAGNDRSSLGKGPFNVLIRSQSGWSGWAVGKPRALRPEVGAEIDRLLAGDNFWQQEGFVYGQPCPGTGRVMQVVHRGRDKFSRQPCGPQGLAGRLADIAATERLPRGPLPPEGGRELMLRGSRGSDYEGALPPPQDADAAELIMHLKSRSTYALRDGRMDAFLEPYAQNVTVVWPSGVERGKGALRRRASSARWNGIEKRHLTPGEARLRQTGSDSFTLTGTYAYWDGQRESRMPFTSRWKKRRGTWEIVREEIGTEQRVAGS
jgi:hypothetical protein